MSTSSVNSLSPLTGLTGQFKFIFRHQVPLLQQLTHGLAEVSKRPTNRFSMLSLPRRTTVHSFANATDHAGLSNFRTVHHKLGTHLIIKSPPANALSDPLGAMASKKFSTSSDSSILHATADSTASTGAHTISIANLAASSSNAVASGGTTFTTDGSRHLSRRRLRRFRHRKRQ